MRLAMSGHSGSALLRRNGPKAVYTNEMPSSAAARGQAGIAANSSGIPERAHLCRVIPENQAHEVPARDRDRKFDLVVRERKRRTAFKIRSLHGIR